jgi:inhibitor of KinA sporulation pathway (predicted exonuclease)
MKTDRASYFLIIDLEATCSDDGIIPRHEMEIIDLRCGDAQQSNMGN